MFFDELKSKMDKYTHFVYKLSHELPQHELYGLTSQLRRAALSVVLNYIEGFARRKNKVFINFLEISYGSLQESRYLLNFAFDEKYIKLDDFKAADAMADEIGAMLWKTIEIKEQGSKTKDQ